jgi:g-D-glutamyl-meso-diaminopimelate peptidase
VGDAPLAAPEARALYEFTNMHDIKMILAYHSQGNIIYWKYQDYLPPQSLAIGEALSIASGYPLELTPEESSYAGYKDWFISQYNRPGYTVETGSGTNPLPVKQFDEIYRANVPLIAAALRECAGL